MNKQSAVLIVKSKNADASADSIEKDIKSKCNLNMLNVSVDSTKKVKNALIVNCNDGESLKKLQNFFNNVPGF